MKRLILLLLIISPGLTGCWLFFHKDDDYEFEYEYIITDTPVNLEKLNSSFDDYNSDLPYQYQGQRLFYSTNRNNFERTYDIIAKDLEITYHRRDGVLNIASSHNGAFELENKIFQLINTSSNELGPYSYFGTSGWSYFFYANDEDTDLDIRFTYYKNADWSYNGSKAVYGPFLSSAINSEYDDAYPAINRTGNRIYFCSNRENGQFDIYSAGLSGTVTLHEYLISSVPIAVSKETILSGSGNDKCPSITKNILVFTSDREGGFGGYDLYYSLFENGQWGQPINFGDKINSEYDEYRPIAVSSWSDAGDLMIFSSNRAGGLGGFDLYCVRIGDLIDYGFD